MYRINLATEIIKSNDIKFKFFKIVNYITLLITIVVLSLSAYAGYKKISITKLDSEITDLINTIDNKRTAEVVLLEQLWAEYDYKLQAVSEQLSNTTKYGLVLKEFATRLPYDAVLVSMVVSGDNMDAVINVPQGSMTKLKSFYDYAEELKKTFEGSYFINDGSIKVMSWILENEKKKPGFETLNVQFGLNSRKRL